MKSIPRPLRIALIVALGMGVAVAQNTYLALGDSIPFGYDPTVPLTPQTAPQILSYYHGYPQFVATSLNLTLANASCPGQTSASFINVTAPDNGCDEWRAYPLPLFVTYSSLSESQLQYAISYLTANPKTKLVTITIGGDDLLLLEDACTTASPTNPSAIESCVSAGLGKVLADFAVNLTKIYLGLRFTAHYEGPIVAVNYFSPNYTNEPDTLAVGELDTITFGVTAAFGGKVADVFTAFAEASVAGEGLPCAPNVGLAFATATTATTGLCDVHPTKAGQQLIATLIEKALQKN